MSRAEWPSSQTLRACRWLLSRAARAVPRETRRAWLEEWEGELFALHARGERGLSLFRFAVGGWREARWEGSRSDPWGAGVVQDVRYAVRRLARSPGFTLVAILVLAIGIGANTALFSALKAALLQGLPYPDADRLVMVDLLVERASGEPADTLPWSYPKFALVRDGLRAARVAGWSSRQGALTGMGEATRVGVEYVSADYLGVLGVTPAIGRGFDAAHEPPAAGTVVLLSYGLWQTRFGADPGILGRSVTIDHTPLEVVGVLPAGFRGLSGGADVWVPLAALTTIQNPRRLQQEQAHWMRVVGRLEPGSSAERAAAEARGVGAALTEAYPPPFAAGATHGVALVPLQRARVNAVARLAIAAVSACGLVVLLIACANVGGLLLARASARRSDFAVRAALGAGRTRLAREYLIESLLLAGAGGALGILLAHAVQGAVAASVRYALDTSSTRGLLYFDAAGLGVDGAVLAGGVVLALLTGLLFGILPARAASRPDLTQDLRTAARAVDGRPGDTVAAGRGTLVTAQLALTLVLLCCAGLVAASFAKLSAVDQGFTRTNVLTAAFDHGPRHTADQNRAFEASLLERVAALPGVTAVAVAPCAPLAPPCEITAVRSVDGIDLAPGGKGAARSEAELSSILTYAVSDDYFGTLGIRIIAGRTFGPADSPEGQPVAILNESAARKHFPDGAALGRRIAVTHSLTDGREAEIVGVVGDVRYGSLEEPAMPAIYFSRRQAPDSYGTLFVQTRTDPRSLTAGVRAVVAAIDSDLPLDDVTTMAARSSLATARTRVVLGLLLSFAATGLLLSAVGLYGLVAYAVSRRTRELGLRLALGADARAVLRLTMRPPALLALAGVGVGLAASLALTRFLEGLLFGVQPSDPRVLAAATAVLLGVALLAAWVPARRALRVDPADSLRAE